jgi:hypothetical protein
MRRRWLLERKCRDWTRIIPLAWPGADLKICRLFTSTMLERVNLLLGAPSEQTACGPDDHMRSLPGICWHQHLRWRVINYGGPHEEQQNTVEPKGEAETKTQTTMLWQRLRCWTRRTAFARKIAQYHCHWRCDHLQRLGHVQATCITHPDNESREAGYQHA